MGYPQKKSPIPDFFDSIGSFPHVKETLMRSVQIGELEIGNHLPLTVLGGINVLEDKDLPFRACEEFIASTARHQISYVFKASFDKANRSSIRSFRGPGLEEGLNLLSKVKSQFDVPVLTDIHEPAQAPLVAEVADILQIPAFLCRQTDLILAAAQTKKPIHIKKGQFLAPEDMKNITVKFQEAGNTKLILCERGVSFGYHNLVVDPLSFPIMKEIGYPVSFDVTHSLQLPGAQGTSAGGRRQYLDSLTCAGLSQGIAALFVEAHPDPPKAKCDGGCALSLKDLDLFLKKAKRMDETAKELHSALN